MITRNGTRPASTLIRLLVLAAVVTAIGLRLPRSSASAVPISEVILISEGGTRP